MVGYLSVVGSKMMGHPSVVGSKMVGYLSYVGSKMGRDRMLVGFRTTYAISAYHH